jgi:tripartite-type tricarboxylate transporter receptor subunit TctC
VTGIPGNELTAWAGYVVPAHTPREIVLRLNTEINKMLLSPSVVKAYAARGTPP